ncbi:MAG: GIY-YIG nuclease family protein [Agitococcus sp.]|nr:GIY-YIG nuclease family protein [Agitococcus sp.]MDO9177166.1 GIY-YIG nuclease family protein [Agitococcus sp.]
MPNYLYIAKEMGSTNVYKVGRTQRCALTRVAELKGQSRAEFGLVAAFATLDDKFAEEVAHRLLDNDEHVSRVVNARKELFFCTEEQARAACKKGVRCANVKVMQQGGEERASANINRYRMPKSTFWRRLGESPIVFNTEQMPLAQLISRAAIEPRAEARLKSMGVTKVAVKKTGVEFSVNWGSASHMRKLVNVLGLATGIPHTNALFLSDTL